MDTVLAAAIGAVVAIVVQLFTRATSKNMIKSDTISKNRVEWIREVREHIKKFLAIYMDDTATSKSEKLDLEKRKISLYMRANVESYRKLLLALDTCVKNPKYNELECDYMIKCAQEVFSEVWIRAKHESGITEKEDKTYDDMFGNTP